ncbi:MAG TPA: flagellar filament outer layer protein FlaA [Treponema sp.]|uniref:flagellar filament outer layer protein FlaA n=1 Tax=Gracilinema caldarium TaxID=215591 RepID=UPI00169DC1E7|nr:flagellar filament outer layer protein FlaA [Gracilinema caldarium]NLJ09556.1 flagellar filament protein FlaA [Treponema sp.]HON12525.1 flagellar filament outer layer protein FlaA [Treponema sp.]HPC71077.1 flagellar filament outer layer protein FlaA [Treponema sp.]HRS02944.1 flagellar filament outer layer protein FlaA [Treponema sp.]HRU27516.1 flagellar filament outer layer protein FlaA [Treponema sp.]
MKRSIVAVILLTSTAFLFAQTEVGAPNPEKVGVESAQQKLKEVSVDKFEQAGFWISKMSSDEGFTTTRLFEGSPAGKQPIPEEKDLNIPDKYVLGTRVDFLRRGYNTFTLLPLRPIPIEGITKTISVWVVGRNYNHTLKILIQDFFGREYELYMGKLNFQGWKKLTVAIPPQAPDGRNGIVQRDYHYNSQMGIKVTGFKVECDPMESYGSYYLYLDDLRAVTDLFAEENRDPDDMVDSW